MITVSDIRRRFSLEPDGQVRSLVTGRIVRGMLDPRGYRKLHLAYRADGSAVRMYYHRVVYALHYGELPAEIDHINRDKADNRPSNLRAITRGDNIRNAGTRKRSVALPKGVYPNKKRFRAAFRDPALGRTVHLGTFDTPEEASKVYKAAFKARFGQ